MSFSKIILFLTLLISLFGIIFSLALYFITAKAKCTGQTSDFYRNILIICLSNIIVFDSLIFLWKSFDENHYFYIFVILGIVFLMINGGFSLYFYKQFNKDKKVQCQISGNKLIFLEKSALVLGIIGIVLGTCLLLLLLWKIFHKGSTSEALLLA